MKDDFFDIEESELIKNKKETPADYIKRIMWDSDSLAYDDDFDPHNWITNTIEYMAKKRVEYEEDLDRRVRDVVKFYKRPFDEFLNAIRECKKDNIKLPICITEIYDEVVRSGYKDQFIEFEDES